MAKNETTKAPEVEKFDLCAIVASESPLTQEQKDALVATYDKLIADNTKLIEDNTAFKAEIYALRIAEGVTADVVKVTVKDGEFTVKGKKHAFKKGISKVFIGGKNTSVAEALKNEAYLVSLVENKSKLINPVD